MRKLLLALLEVLMACAVCAGQGTVPDTTSGGGVSDFLPYIASPEFDARLSVGFNYDLLEDPTRVSFEYPRGYLGLNIPLSYGLNKSLTDQMTTGVADLFPEGEEFEPTASARQNANTTIRVEVPMLRGVGEFSNIQNFFLKYTNTLGEPRLVIQPAIDSIDLMMQGMISVPLEVSMGWETMTLGYAYKISDKLKVAMNLHRHIFKFDVAAKIDIDLLGYLELDLPEIAPTTGEGETDELIAEASNDLMQGIGRQWINYMVAGEARGHYETETWSPTFAAHYWRVGLVARIGVNTRAPGYLSAKYVVPFFVDPETFATDDLADPDYLMENINRFVNGETDSIEYTTTSDLIWKMPTGLTFTFDIVPDRFWISYTKFIGEINMLLPNIATIQIPQGLSSDSVQPTSETVNFDVGVTVDHIIMLHGAFQNAFANLGVFTLDLRYGDKDNLLEQVYPVPFLGGALLPVLNFGTTFGAKLKLLLELDLLPLSALKTGIIYYFLSII